MGVIHASIGTHIRFSAAEVPPEFMRSVIGALTIRNPEKDRAVRELVRGAERMPDWIELWGAEGNELVIPRGFVHQFEWIANQSGFDLEWHSEMVEVVASSFQQVPKISLRGYQTTALDELFEFSNGIYKAPTAAGKTRVMLEMIRFCMQRAIVFVEKVDLAHQWRRAATELGFQSIGIIGDGEWNEQDLTIALRPSIWGHRERLRADGWFKKFGLLCVDEAHHAVADSYWTLIQLFPAFYRLGCTATPVRDEETFPIARAVIGPVVHETPPEDVGESLVTPSIKVLKTDFYYEYEPTHRVKNPATGRWNRVQNNYNAMMDSLQTDVARNSLIVRTALGEADLDHAVLILSRRKEHLRELHSLAQTMLSEQGLGSQEMPLFMVTGDNSSGAEAIYGAIDKLERSILFSTIADEGTDIPRLDRLFLAYPARKLLFFEQAIGRIMRPHPKKTDAVVYDFMDVNADLLRGQFRSRRQDLYNQRGFDVRFLN